MKKYFFLLLIAFVPTMLLAQAAGGAIKRPAKKQQTTKPTAKKVNVIPPVIQSLINNMVNVEGGTFVMGTDDWDGKYPYQGTPAHQVTLSSFSIGKYEVTQEEWQAVMGSNPSLHKDIKCPVEQVSWEDCQKFIRKLNAMTGKRFRLPTEAEWEYAARGGNRSMGYKFSGSNDPNQVAWTQENSGDHALNIGYLDWDTSHSNNNRTHPVGQKLPNELGLYDMSGNVSEWCQDIYEERFSSESQINPKGPSKPLNQHNIPYRVLRGGSWSFSVDHSQVLVRHDREPWNESMFDGLRLAY